MRRDDNVVEDCREIDRLLQRIQEETDCGQKRAEAIYGLWLRERELEKLSLAANAPMLVDPRRTNLGDLLRMSARPGTLVRAELPPDQPPVQQVGAMRSGEQALVWAALCRLEILRARLQNEDDSVSVDDLSIIIDDLQTALGKQEPDEDGEPEPEPDNACVDGDDAEPSWADFEDAPVYGRCPETGKLVELGS